MTMLTSQPGDLHSWDDLQDGCLYVDITEHHVDYGGCWRGYAQWLVTCGQTRLVDYASHHHEKRSLGCAESLHAVVVAVGLETVGDFRAAIAAHQARTAV